MKSARIPKGWSFWVDGGPNEEIAWFQAREMKDARQFVRPDLFVRVQVIRGPGTWWILKKEEKREERETA